MRRESTPQRERRQAERKGYVNSATAILGSSSPTGPSSSEFEADMEDVDEDEHDARRSKPEEVTVHLVTCFLQHALNLCLMQNSAGTMAETEVRARIERKTADMRVGDATVTAEDDGGVCRMRWQNHGWVMDHAYLALLEAKRGFKHIHFDEKTGKHIPVVSNEAPSPVPWRGSDRVEEAPEAIATRVKFPPSPHLTLPQQVISSSPS